jgi:tetraacyldisaccharide 4'-kinase
VGNLRAGGAGKTPVVGAIARLLLSRGERPAILTRGYARRVAHDGVTVVSDGTRVLAGVEVAGDEALMLARALTGVPVLVGADRYLSGSLAECHLGATVHVLDDGFQHLALARDVDLLVVDEDDLSERLLPAGRLREPLDAASVADALLTSAPADEFDRLRTRLGVPTLFAVTRVLGSDPRLTPGMNYPGSDGGLTPPPALAVAGIARPERFFNDLAAGGWRLTGTQVFRDHHFFSRADFDRIVRTARESGAEAVVTTEKDAVRLEQFADGTFPILAVPLRVSIDPAFGDWLAIRAGLGGTKPLDRRA